MPRGCLPMSAATPAAIFVAGMVLVASMIMDSFGRYPVGTIHDHSMEVWLGDSLAG